MEIGHTLIYVFSSDHNDHVGRLFFGEKAVRRSGDKGAHGSCECGMLSFSYQGRFWLPGTSCTSSDAGDLRGSASSDMLPRQRRRRPRDRCSGISLVDVVSGVDIDSEKVGRCQRIRSPSPRKDSGRSSRMELIIFVLLFSSQVNNSLQF